MEHKEDLHVAALKWLDSSGGLTQLHSALVSRTVLCPAPKVLRMPIFVNFMQLHEINGELANLVVNRPLEAQQVFHKVMHIASVAIALKLNGRHLDSSEIFGEDDHCTPEPVAYVPDADNITSLYLEEDPKLTNSHATLDDLISEKLTMDKEDLDLTLESLASNLPLDACVSGDSSRILTAAQIHTPLHVDGIPWIREWVVNGVRELPLQLEEPKLALVSGKVISVSLPTSYTVWARYVCSSSDCVGMARDLHVRVFAVGQSETDTIHQHPKCRVCYSPLVEDPSSRELGEKMTLFLLPDVQADALAKETYTRVQALKIILRDERMHGLEPGQPLAATIMVSPQHHSQLPSLEAILVHPPTPFRPPSSLPPMFRRLVEDRRSSPWSLVMTLAYMFAASVTPAGTFHTFKLALLLSLASCSSIKPGLAVLGVGSNTTLLLRLLWYSARFAPCSVIHSSLNSVTACCTKDSEGNIWVNGGSLLMARGGVCVLGDFSKFKKESQESVCRALESGIVQVECSTRVHQQIPTLSYPLRAAAWACYDPSHACNRATKESHDSFLHVPLGDLKKLVTDVFGLVVYTETPGGECESEAEEVIIMHTLLEGTRSQPPTPPLLPPDQLSEYLCMVRSLEVVFSDTAERLIRGYYVATRRLRGDCVQGSSVPITAMNMLAQVAASHARLALRHTVEGWDAVTAVLLCEEALVAHSGYSLLRVPPTPHLPLHNDLHTLVGRKNDERMVNFQRTLEEFIDTHTGDIPPVIGP